MQRHSQIQSIFTYISQSHTSCILHIKITFKNNKNISDPNKNKEQITRKHPGPAGSHRRPQAPARPRDGQAAHQESPLRHHNKKTGSDEMEVNLAD
jgi:hypothetical protein